MYRGQLWTMRQFAGFGTAEETNERFRYLLDHGQTGLSTAFDMPTLMGYDSDHPRSLGEVGREGVAIDSLADMETLFDGIPLGEVSTSMTINAPGGDAARVLRLRRARSRASPRERAARHDPDGHPQGVHRAEGVHLPAGALDAPRRRHDRVLRARDAAVASRLDLRLPHPRGRLERGAGARVHARGRLHVRRLGASSAACDVDDFAPRLSFFFNAHLDFFEEIAKYRAARRIWARELRERYGAKNPRSWLMRFHTQTAGVSLTAQQPEVNIVRTALEALAAVLGGTQSLHTNSFDEALGAADRGRGPDRAAHAAGDRARDRSRQHDRPARRLVLRRAADEHARGRGVRVLRPHREARRRRARRSRRTSSSARSPRRRSATSRRSRRSSGSSSASTGTSSRTSRELDILRIDPALEKKQIDRVQALRATARLGRGRGRAGAPEGGRAHDGDNLMPHVVEAARAYVTIGELCDALRDTWGTWRETPVF